MADLIKVNQVMERREASDRESYNFTRTTAELLGQIFGEKVDTFSWQGVSFSGMHGADYGFNGYRLLGIKMVTGTYGNRTIRKVMIDRNGMFDAEAVRAKFAELRVIADAQEARYQEGRRQRAEASQVLAQIVKEVNHPEPDYNSPVQLQDYTATAVLLRSKANGTQLKAIEAILGEQKLEVRLVVPKEKAVAVYNILANKT